MTKTNKNKDIHRFPAPRSSITSSSTASEFRSDPDADRLWILKGTNRVPNFWGFKIHSALLIVSLWFSGMISILLPLASLIEFHGKRDNLVNYFSLFNSHIALISWTILIPWSSHLLFHTKLCLLLYANKLFLAYSVVSFCEKFLELCHMKKIDEMKDQYACHRLVSSGDCCNFCGGLNMSVFNAISGIVSLACCKIETLYATCTRITQLAVVLPPFSLLQKFTSSASKIKVQRLTLHQRLKAMLQTNFLSNYLITHVRCMFSYHMCHASSFLFK